MGMLFDILKVMMRGKLQDSWILVFYWHMALTEKWRGLWYRNAVTGYDMVPLSRFLVYYGVLKLRVVVTIVKFSLGITRNYLDLFKVPNSGVVWVFCTKD